MKEKKVCVICGFDKRVHQHHIIKRVLCGSDEPDNLIYLCPNHHWIADFGTEEERLEILRMIKKMTGKSGKEIDKGEKDILDLKIRALEEEFLCGVPFPTSNGTYNKPFSEDQWEQHKNSWNYEQTLKNLLGRGSDINQSLLLNKRAEILILINKLKAELKSTRF